MQLKQLLVIVEQVVQLESHCKHCKIPAGSGTVMSTGHDNKH